MEIYSEDRVFQRVREASRGEIRGGRKGINEEDDIHTFKGSGRNVE